MEHTVTEEGATLPCAGRCGPRSIRQARTEPVAARWARQTTASILSAVAMFALLPGQEAWAGSVFIPEAGSVAEIEVVSIKEARFRFVVRQEYDFSCGSAALATLLTYHYELPKSESDIFFAMFEVGDRERIQREGFSLADMQQYLKTVGLRSNGFNVKLPQLAEANIPAITLINTNGYRHFVVIKGITDRHVLVGDPALGIKRYPIAEFEEIWIPVAFIIEERVETARANYSTDREWDTIVKSPIGNAMSPADLGAFTIALPRFNEF